MLVYIAGIAIVLTILFDLSRITSLGAIFYLVMDIGIHFGLLKNLRKKVDFKAAIVISAIVLDVIVLAGFIFTKAKNDLTVVIVSIGIMLLIYAGEKWFLLKQKESD